MTADFITQLKYKNGTPPVSRENGVRYLCKKEELESTKEILSTKKVLLIEKNQQLNNDTLDRKEIIRGYVNNPNLEILYVDYDEIELALKKKEPDMMIAMQSKVISCSDFDDLCFLPMYTQKERSKQKKTTALIITGSMVAMVGLLVGMVAGMSAIMHKI